MIFKQGFNFKMRYFQVSKHDRSGHDIFLYPNQLAKKMFKKYYLTQ